MRINRLLHVLFTISIEWVYFLLVIMVLFTTMTEFLQQWGIMEETLSITEIQYYGFLSVVLAINNFISKKFFGITLWKE